MVITHDLTPLNSMADSLLHRHTPSDCSVFKHTPRQAGSNPLQLNNLPQASHLTSFCLSLLVCKMEGDKCGNSSKRLLKQAIIDNI